MFIPQAALTFSSLIKLWVLGVFYGNKLIAVGVQKRQLEPWQSRVLGQMKLPKTFVLSSAMAVPLEKINVFAKVIGVGIDRDKYQPATSPLALRKKYNIPEDRRVLLHVGHIRESRNLQWLIEIKADLPDLEVILVGSTATEQEMGLCKQLENAGIRVMREYLPQIQEIYQLADVYCFPVTLATAAMETPLSVLEAMSTNLPIITTRFGRLPEQFNDAPYYRYADSAPEMVTLLKSGFETNCDNREKTALYSWSASAERLLA